MRPSIDESASACKVSVCVKDLLLSSDTGTSDKVRGGRDLEEDLEEDLREEVTVSRDVATETHGWLTT